METSLRKLILTSLVIEFQGLPMIRLERALPREHIIGILETGVSEFKFLAINFIEFTRLVPILLNCFEEVSQQMTH